MYRYRRPLAKDILFVASIALGWLLWWHHRSGHPPLSGRPSAELLAVLSWSVLSGTLVAALLYWTDYFRPFKRPRLFLSQSNARARCKAM